MHNGKFFETGCDLAFMLPMLEMAGRRILYVSEPLYLYNTKNSINDYKVHAHQRKQDFKNIRSKKEYTRLEGC